MESDLHVEYAEIIADVEKHIEYDAKFPCCSCERLFQRKKVTEFKFSAEKFSSDVWKLLKQHMSQSNSSTGLVTLRVNTVGLYCVQIGFHAGASSMVW